jgi:4-hydroxy-tetrahydrodipicolinate reductase
MIKVVIIGVCGKMGSALVSLISEQSDLELVGGVESFGHPQVDAPLGTGKIFADLESVVEYCDVGVEFTTPDASVRHAEIIANFGKCYILGTTGFSTNQMDELKKLSQKIPIFYSPNFSIGVNVLFNLTESAAKLLGDNFDVEILEIHHTQKRDAPSGTAKKLVEMIEKVSGKKKVITERTGTGKEKNKDEIGVFSIRSGDTVGEHYVIFGQKGERIELVHKASNRLAFAQGVIRAIRFIRDKSRGFYGMEQILNAKL